MSRYREQPGPYLTGTGCRIEGRAQQPLHPAPSLLVEARRGGYGRWPARGREGRWPAVLGGHEMSGGASGRLAVEEEARERAIRLIDFLEAYHLRRFPPVRDIADYKDVRITEADLPIGAPGFTFSPGGATWLTVDLVDLPTTPVPPDGLDDWLAGPVIATTEPAIRHPDRLSRALIDLADGMEDLGPLDALGADALAARGVAGVEPGTVSVAVRTARQELDQATRSLQPWVESIWRPWAARWFVAEAVRSFYKQLFDLRVRLDRERETFELVWGFAPTRWLCEVDTAPTRVDHPMLTVAAELEYEQATGCLTVSPAGALTVETHWTIGLPMSDRRGYIDQRTSMDQVELDPWGPACLDAVRSLLRSLDHDGRVVDGATTTSFESNAVVDATGWVLYVRRHRPNLEGFLDDQRRIYAEGGAVPAPFAALVVDQPSLLDDDPGELDSGGGEIPSPAGHRTEAEQELLPLPANEEQRQIVELARSRAGVTAQGPPGTGKSHTIANLISHYVAHGKRVLVTAAKEQALKVLIDKVPKDIQDLCVPVLGSDAAARDRLQRSVAEIAARSQQRPNLESINQLQTELERIEAHYAASTNLLRTKRAAETAAPPLRPAGVTADEWTPSTAAAWVAAHRDLSGLPDAVDPASAPPLSDDEYAELVHLCRRVLAGDATAALTVLPQPNDLPTGGQLASLRSAKTRLENALSKAEDRVLSWGAVDAVQPADLATLAGELDEWVDWHAKANGSWVSTVLSDAHDQSLAAGWHEFTRDAAAERDAVLAINRSLAAHTVAIALPPGVMPTPEFTQGLDEARSRFAAGKSLGVLQRAARRTLDLCTTNGHVPATVDDIDLVLADLARREHRQRLANRWINIAARVDAPPLGDERLIEDVIGERITEVSAALEWSVLTWPMLAQRLTDAGVRTPPVPDGTDLSQLADTCRTLRQRHRLNEIDNQLRNLADDLERHGAEVGASALWAQLRQALIEQADSQWDALRDRAQHLIDLIPAAAQRRDLLTRLRGAAPQLASLVEDAESPLSGDFEQCWRWRQLERWLVALDEPPQPAELQARLERLAIDRRRVTTDLVAAKAWANLAASIDDRRRTALNRFTTANARLGKGTGRYAPMWAAEARAAMVDAQDAVPVWIMPLHRALVSFRPKAEPPFDVVIVDEASQVGLLESPVLGLANRAIVVGDDQQTSPENVGLERQGILDLIDDFLGAISDRRTRFSPEASLYDLARQRFPQVVQLREHFRCLPRIIEFSSDRWYSGTIVPLRDRPPAPGWQAVGTVFVPSGVRRPADDTNRAEAEAVVVLIAELAERPEYDTMTFGVVTLLGSGQAPFIREMLFDRFGPRFIEDRKLRVGDPAAFQGDERDVVILSMVVAHDTDRRIGAMTGAPAGRRINVAASRAANQLWVVHSVGVDAFHPDDPRRWLLEYCTTPQDEAAAQAALDKTESQFERDVLSRVLARGYTRVHTQYPVGGYRIDIVIEGPESRLAVECDGDYWHGPDMWDHDRARQTVLERAGWTFERIRGSSFYRDPDAALEPLWQRLDTLDIPTGAWEHDTRPRPANRVWPDDFPEETGPFVTADAVVAAPPLVMSGPPVKGQQLLDTSDRLMVSDGHPSTSEVRQWARDVGHHVGDRGRLSPEVISAWNRAFPNRSYTR